MPAENCVESKQLADFFKHLPAQNLAFDGQSPPLLIVQQKAFLAGFLSENLILSLQILNDNLLLPVDPAGEDEEIELPGLKNEIHGISGC